MKNFLITAMGRSGTTFLSSNMNRSKKWVVFHEPGDWHELKYPVERMQKRFDRNYYGEVNSYMRFVIDKIKCEKKGIILRNPIDLWLSITSWHNQKRWVHVLKAKWGQDFKMFMKAIPHLLKLAETGEYYVISFERMITELGYLKAIFEHFEIDDVDVNDEMVNTRINAAPEKSRTSWENFSPEIKNKVFNLNDDYLKRTRRIFAERNNYIPRLNWQAIEFLEKIITPENIILETGTGNSTIWFARRVQRVVSFEDKKNWHDKILESLKKENLRNVEIYFDAHYVEKPFHAMLNKRDNVLYDVILLDGPNIGPGRIPLIIKLIPLLKQGGYLILDDTEKGWYEPGIRYLDNLKWETYAFKGKSWYMPYKEGRAYRKPKMEK